MTRIKKSRKAGESSPKHAPRSKKEERVSARKKQDSGNKAGSRQNPAGGSGSNSQRSGAKDPRIGSKKLVPLSLNNAPAKTVKAANVKLTDEQKLLQLEEDPRLNLLLDMLEEGRDLSAEDQQWLDKQLAKIEQLMEKLGIEELDEAEVLDEQEDDLLQKYEAGLQQLKQYQKD